MSTTQEAATATNKSVMKDTTRAIVCIVDMTFLKNLNEKNPGTSIYYLSNDEVKQAIKLVCQDKEAISDNGKYFLKISATKGDVITWMETNIDKSAINDVVIKDIRPIGNWSKYMKNFNGDYCITEKQQVMKAYYDGKNLGYSNRLMDYTKAEVKEVPSTGHVDLNYQIDVELVKLNSIGQVEVVRQFSYDPIIRLSK